MSRSEGIDKALKTHHLDALVAVTSGPAWTTDLVNGDHYLGSSTTPAAVAGYPNVTVPAGEAFGLPIGVTFLGAAWTEPALIRMAYAFTQGAHQRRAPLFLPTVSSDLTTPAGNVSPQHKSIYP
jgi:amidase